MTNSVGGVATHHDLFQLALPDYQVLRDCAGGRTLINARGDVYLPKPPALAIPAMDPRGDKYRFLLSHAEFPSLVSDGLEKMQGVVHQRAPKVTLPASMEYLLERATPDGKTLNELYMQVTNDVFLMGSTGLLAEVYPQGDRVYLCQYAAERIINWRMQRDPSGIRLLFVVLHEREEEPTQDGFGVEYVNAYRVCRYTPAGYVQELWRDGAKSGDPVQMARDPLQPSRRGRAWKEIPFIRINANNLEIEPGRMPLLPVAHKALDVYRKSAGFHRAIYNKEDPVMMRVGINETEASAMNTVGGSAVWDAANPDAKGFYIEMSGDVLALALDVMKSDTAEARQIIGKLIDDSKGGVESGEALRERRAANAVTLASMVTNIGYGMERALRHVAVAIGADPAEVKFEPSLDFMAPVFVAKDAVELVTAKNSGFPISLSSMHEVARKGGLTMLSFDDEMELIEDEDPTGVVKRPPGDPIEDDPDDQAA